MITLQNPGLLTTLQDAGRRGWQKYGVPVAGAMDAQSLFMANVLAGNPPELAGLEITALGPTLLFHTPVAFALCGGQFPALLNGQPIAMNRAHSAPAGSVLQIGAAQEGFRCYLALQGGFALAPVMGSLSTYLKGGFGGLDGRPLQKGDTLPLANPQFWLPNMEQRSFTPQPLPKEPVIRLLPGPQADCFDTRGWATLLREPYTIGQSSDRMGYRLEGPAIARAPGFDGNILSDGVAMGSIQVPDGKPLIMMADRQTTGGYGKIATVITADLPLLAQCKPGDTIRFAEATLAEAHGALADQHRHLAALEQAVNQPEGLW